MVRIIRQMKISAIPRIRRWKPAARASSCWEGSTRIMMGVASTLRPIPAGNARMAMIRKAEETMRLAEALSCRARAAAAKGTRLMVTG